MRPFLRWIVNGKPKPPPTIYAEFTFEDPRTDALKAMAAAAEAQTLLLERFTTAAEHVAATLDRAEQRVLGAYLPAIESAETAELDG
jgi:hypothetical protein